MFHGVIYILLGHSNVFRDTYLWKGHVNVEGAMDPGKGHLFVF